MITLDEAVNVNEFHLDSGCVKGQRMYRVFRNGRTQRWKRNSEKFRIPVKHGLYEYGSIDNYFLDNADDFHTVDSCPLLQEKVSE